MDNIDLGTASLAVGLLTTMVIGAVEFVKRLFRRDYEAATIIAVSTLIGGLGGLLLFKEIGLALGIVIGLSGSGIIAGLKSVGTGTSKSLK